MKLSRVERWMLSNQYRILEALHPDEAEDLKETRVAIERGFELHYDWNIPNIYDESDVMTEAQCIEIGEMLSMFTALSESYDALSDKSGLKDWKVQLIGFDGNTEFKEMGYAKYLCKVDGRKRANLRDKIVDSHIPVLNRYRAMLNIWKGIDQKLDLTKEQMIEFASLTW